MRNGRWLIFAISISYVSSALAFTPPTQSAIDQAKASAAFLEAQQLSAREGGHLWGKSLYGPMIFVFPATREIVANEADSGRVLHKEGSVYVGNLPKEIIIANTAIDWQGKRWTMVMWPLPTNSQPRQRLLAHELFHRIQPELHLPMADPANPQLDSLEGRLWLQLEWRALAAALIESGGPKVQAICDALAFRNHRRQMFADSAESERALEMNEGLAEYTGLSASAPDASSARWRMVARLTVPESDTFVRSFAYASGPAYGLLLDERLPSWRGKLSASSDLGTLLSSTVHDSSVASIDQRALDYGAGAMRIVETERDAMAKAERDRYRKLLVEGPILTLPNAGKFNYGFDPNNLVPLPDAGTVYPTMHASDAWGTLEVQDGALLSTDFKNLTVAAPGNTAGTHMQGPGWKLELAAGWSLVPAAKAGSYTLQDK